MNWFKDKKNLPIIIVAAVVIVVGATVGILFATGVLPPQSQTASTPAPATAAPGAPAAPGTPGAPAVPGAPAAPVGATAGPTPGSAATPPSPGPANPANPAGASRMSPGKGQPLSAKAGAKTGPKVAGAPGTGTPATVPPGVQIAETPDPFVLPSSTAKTLQQLRQEAQEAAVTPTLPILPDPFISTFHQQATSTTTGTTDQNGIPPPPPGPQDAGPNMRMAGVLYGNGIWALLETDGKTEEVQPGDTTDEGKVVSIEPNSMILMTSDNRLIKVSLSANPTGDQSANNGGM
jgi:hypothetical protein